MIVLLNGHSLAAKNRFQAEKLAIQLNERSSTATLTLSDDAPVISVGDWIKWEEGPAHGVVWRVKSIDEQFDTQTRTVNLEHMINSLRDRLMFGETETSDISGSDKTNPTAPQTIRYILRYQNDWVLGGIAGYDAVRNPYTFNGDSLYSALETVSGSLEDCIWEYDFSVYPFRLNIGHLDSTVCSEMRTDRNIKTLKKTIDRSRMYTRHYPIGKDNLTISGDYVSKNESKYGIISKTETDQSLDTEAKLRGWANERLRRHAEPYVTVTISGLDLTEATGEPLDSFVIGKMCRVPLPEFETTINERVTKLSYSDVIAEPMNVTVTLANELIDVANIINELAETSGSGGSGGRTSAKNNEEKHAWIINENERVGLLAEAVAGPGADKDWSRVSEIIVDGKGIHQRVTKTEGDIVTAESNIEMLEDQIKLKVSKGNLISEINMAPGRIKISAEKIDLDGYVTAGELKTVNGDIRDLVTGVTTADAIKARAIYATMGFTYQNHAVAFRTITINGTEYHLLGYV